MKKSGIIILCVVALIGAAYFSISSFRVFIMEEPNIIQTIKSSNGKYVAFVFENNTGATTNFTYRLSVLKNGKKPKQGDIGNTYISYGKFDIEWLDDNTLKVNNNPTDNIFKQETKVSGVDIKYNYIK